MALAPTWPNKGVVVVNDGLPVGTQFLKPIGYRRRSRTGASVNVLICEQKAFWSERVGAESGVKGMPSWRYLDSAR